MAETQQERKERILAKAVPDTAAWIKAHAGQDAASTMADLVVTIVLCTLEDLGVIPRRDS